MALPRSQFLAALTHRLPLRMVLVVSFVLQITAAVGLTAGLSLRNGQKAVNDLAEQLSDRSTARIQEHLQTYLIQPNLLQRNSRSNILYEDLDTADFNALTRHFWHQLRASDGITSIYYGSEAGEFVGVQERDNGQTVLWERTQASSPVRTTYQLDDQGNRGAVIATQDYDPRLRPWYEAVQKNRRSSWSKIYEFASEDYSVLGITLASPIYGDRGSLRGVIALDLTLEQISSYLKLLDISPNSHAFIVERNGEIVATSAAEPPFVTSSTGEQERLAAIASQEPLISATARYLLGEFGTLESIETAQQFTFRTNGERQLVYTVPFRDGRGIDWLIVTVIPEADFMGQVMANTRNTLLLCLLSLIVASLIAGITARWVAQPILRLNSVSKQLAVGDWDQPIPQGRFKELTELETTFQSMARQLKQSFDQLEDRNRELQRLDKLKDEFLANTSHELRTPLNGIIGLAESLIDGVSGPLTRQTKGNLAMIVASGRRLATLVNDILDFSQLRYNRVQLKPQPVGIREVTDVVLTLSRSMARQKDVQLINAVSPYLPPVLADENRLQQILHNLVGNAVKFTDYGMIGVSAQIMTAEGTSYPRQELFSLNFSAQPGRKAGDGGIATAIDRAAIAISRPPNFTPQPGDYLAVTVSDTGIGIPSDKLERIFEPFEQADGSTSRLYGGMGIGLAVTKQLVELHSGTLQVLSATGVGSQFTFTLPIAGPQTATALTDDDVSVSIPEDDTAALSTPLLNPQNSDTTASWETALNRNGDGSSVRDPQTFLVLVVDDEPVNRQVIVNYLSLNKYRVVQAGNGPDALRMMENGLRPDLILLDVMMPRMTGYEVCRKVRDTYPDYALPIVMLTAKNQVSALVEGLTAGANDYLTKPISKNELLARLKTHLRLSKINLAYSRFVPREFLQFLDKESIVEVELGDQVEQHMSVMFADIRDFTSLSEQMTPEENFHFINAFLSRMEPTIAEHQGFIDKYIGDAIMALFSQGQGADDALRASVAMLERLQSYNTEREANERPPIAIGIGINTGRLMLGTVGGQNRMDGTVISDTVNVAARIERLTRVYGVNLLISHHTFMQLDDANQYAMRVIDRVRMKGKSNFVSVYEVFEPDPPLLKAAKLATKTQFETALLLYFQEAYEDAAAQLQRCLADCPGDEIATIYLHRCRTKMMQER